MYRILLLILILLSLVNMSSAEEEKEFQLQVYLTKKQALEVAFPGADSVEQDKHWLTDEQKKTIGDICFQSITESRMTFYWGRKSGKPMGYMMIDNVIGKSFPITYMALLNVDGTVRDVEIMVYREPRGWEVRDNFFLSQFFGKNAESDFRDINTITGATLSVRAMTRAVSKTVAAYKVLYLNK